MFRNWSVFLSHALIFSRVIDNRQPTKLQTPFVSILLSFVSCFRVPLFILQKPQPAKKEKKKKEDKKEEDDGSRDLGMPAPEKKAPHPLAVMDKEAKSPFAGDTWKKVRHTS